MKETYGADKMWCLLKPMPFDLSDDSEAPSIPPSDDDEDYDDDGDNSDDAKVVSAHGIEEPDLVSCLTRLAFDQLPDSTRVWHRAPRGSRVHRG